MNKKIKVMFLNFHIVEILLILILFYFQFQQTDKIQFVDYFDKTVEIAIKDKAGNEGYATGFKTKYGILTNKHVVMNSDEIYQYIGYRNSYSEDFIKVNNEEVIVDDLYDLALIKMPFDDYFQFDLSFEIGDECYTIGNPNGYGLGLSVGYVSSMNRIENVNCDVLRLNISLNKGNSGGPVFNKKGRIIGIVSFRLLDNSGNALDGIMKDHIGG